MAISDLREGETRALSARPVSENGSSVRRLPRTKQRMTQVHANLFANRKEKENTEEKSKESWDSSRKSIDTNERETYCSQGDDRACIAVYMRGEIETLRHSHSPASSQHTRSNEIYWSFPFLARRQLVCAGDETRYPSHRLHRSLPIVANGPRHE